MRLTSTWPREYVKDWSVKVIASPPLTPAALAFPPVAGWDPCGLAERGTLAVVPGLAALLAWATSEEADIRTEEARAGVEEDAAAEDKGPGKPPGGLPPGAGAGGGGAPVAS